MNRHQQIKNRLMRKDSYLMEFLKEVEELKKIGKEINENEVKKITNMFNGFQKIDRIDFCDDNSFKLNSTPANSYCIVFVSDDYATEFSK